MSSHLKSMFTPIAEIIDTKMRMRILLIRWTEYGWLRAIDMAFADFLWREIPDASPLLILAAALASYQLGRGHVCLDLSATLADPTFVLSFPANDTFPLTGQDHPPLPQEILAALNLEQWQMALEHSDLVGSGPGATPLVRIGSRLYLRRYWRYEREVRASIERLIKISPNIQATLSILELRTVLNILFPSSPVIPNWQKIACALAARNAFSIITGGPGTGKTTTVVSLLVLLQTLALFNTSRNNEAPRFLRISLAAPTGKAAARLNESITRTLSLPHFSNLPYADMVRSSIPTNVTTIHRLLGIHLNTRHFNHHAGNPLALDVLVIDEASMVDLELMAAVFAALPSGARIILLGDKDQLASVEAGGVLGELCLRADNGHYTELTCDWLREITGEQIDSTLIDKHGTAFDQSVVMLRHSYRFSAGIGYLAQAVNTGNTMEVNKIWTQHYPDLALLSVTDTNNESFKKLIVNEINKVSDNALTGYNHYLEIMHRKHPHHDSELADFDAWAHEVLQAHAQFQLLCALRRGPWGVEGLNQQIAFLLHQAGLISESDGWYLGRPILVTRNDYGLGLMNGDIGITLALPSNTDSGWMQRVAFPAGNGKIKWILPTRLRAVETVYALTVHKAQGSEFNHAVLVLPNIMNSILTRELLYTGITRARNFLTLVNPGGATILEQIVQRRVLRASGLWAEHS